ncbi:MAG TPA: response regulator [Polyangia bacterium]|nr:response regulator [Polyangia bacterium]
MRQSAYSAFAPRNQLHRPTHDVLRGIRVLIVDDDEDVRDTLCDVLGGHGAIVAVAGSAQAAREAIVPQPPDLLVSDIAMPREDGLALIASIRGIAGLDDLPAIAVSANVSAIDRQRALAAGFDRFVAKPFDLADILGAVTELLPATIARARMPPSAQCRRP